MKSKWVVEYTHSATVAMEVEAESREEAISTVAETFPAYQGEVLATELDIDAVIPKERITEGEAQKMFLEYLSGDCCNVLSVLQDEEKLLQEWEAWLQQTQVENGFATESDAKRWKPLRTLFLTQGQVKDVNDYLSDALDELLYGSERGMINETEFAWEVSDLRSLRDLFV